VGQVVAQRPLEAGDFVEVGVVDIEAGGQLLQPLQEEEDVEAGYPALMGKMTDPVRIYLKEMGSFPLLTREGEVEVAKKIECGQQELLRVVLSCPISIKEIVTLGKFLRAGKTKTSQKLNCPCAARKPENGRTISEGWESGHFLIIASKKSPRSQE
jgi:hypothetical protein